MRRASRRGLLIAFGLTLALTLLVAAGVADQGWRFSVIAVVIAALAVGALTLVFPHGALFSLGFANGLAIYICLYTILGRAAFPLAEDWARQAAFLLPVIAFVTACLIERRRLARLADDDTRPDLAHLPRVARWMIVLAVIGAACLASPVSRMSEAGQSLMLVLAMGAIAATSVIAMRDVVRLMVDVAAILGQVAQRAGHLAVPIATYLSLFSLLAVTFGSLYRIADALSREPLFANVTGPMRLSFSDALHFSVVTLATVGYGDILPQDDGIRLLAAIQMVSGQLLLLFGFAEIMRGRTEAGR
ncbi:MAG: potassium channel family protein [Acetobacteraceae bacterium]|nr:potassium channel family protein [Acetobacteraceae bacterium]